MTKLTIKSLTVAAFAVSAMMVAGPASAKIETGSNVSDMTVTDSNGVNHNLSDFAGKRVVLEWTNHGCPYVKKHYETGNMQKTQRAVTEDDGAIWLSVISSAPGKQGYVSGEEANTLTASRNAVPTAVILDPTGEAGRTFDAKTTPHLYVIDEAQTLVYQGAIDSDRSIRKSSIDGATNYVLAAMDDLDNGRPVAEADTSPYGCSVKYGS